MKSIVIIMVGLIPGFLYAQGLDTLWTRTYGLSDYAEIGYSAQETSDGGYIIVGHTQSFGAGNYSVYLIKTDSLGDTLWTETYSGEDGSGGPEIGYSVRETSDGGYIIVGESYYPNVHPNVYLIKTDSLGDTLWTRSYGGKYADAGYYVQETSDGGYIIVGYAGTSSYSYFVDVYLIRLTPDITKIEENPQKYSTYDLTFYPLFPNPTRSQTQVHFVLKERAYVSLKIYNAAGELINTLLRETLNQG